MHAEHDIDMDRAIRLTKAGLGKAECELVAGFVAPFFWVHPGDQGDIVISNGSIFFADCGQGCMGITAAHVLLDDKLGYNATKQANPKTVCQVGDLSFDVEGRLIDIDERIDIATFRVTDEEVRSLDKTVLTGHQKTWPPDPPMRGRGVLFAGFPGRERRIDGPREINFGLYVAGGTATSVSDRDVSCQFARENWIDVMGLGLPPMGFPMGGVSGGPVLTIVEHRGLRSWRLAGVIYQGPDPAGIEGLEVLCARRADYIRSDGTVDRTRLI